MKCIASGDIDMQISWFLFKAKATFLSSVLIDLEKRTRPLEKEAVGDLGSNSLSKGKG